MNAPAKRFSLQRLLTSPTPVVEAAPAPVLPPPPAAVAPVAEAPAPVDAEPAALRVMPPRPSKNEAAEESHPKKKRSYSVDMRLCEDLEILAWYQSRSSSSVVEDLIRKHLQHNRALLQKAREIRSAR
jgi:hypothetical protein